MRGKDDSTWHSISADVDRKTIKEWFPNANIYDFGSPNLSKTHKYLIEKSITLTKELADDIFIKGILRKQAFMRIFKDLNSAPQINDTITINSEE